MGTIGARIYSGLHQTSPISVSHNYHSLPIVLANLSEPTTPFCTSRCPLHVAHPTTTRSRPLMCVMCFPIPPTIPTNNSHAHMSHRKGNTNYAWFYHTCMSPVQIAWSYARGLVGQDHHQGFLLPSWILMLDP